MLTRLLAAGLLATFSGAALAQDKPAEQPAKQTGKHADKPAKKDKADETTLKIGDKAPALSVEKWVKGEPVTGFEKGRVYVVEFWATWCPPCIKSMPHLTEIQAKYKDKGVRVIGVTTEDDRNSLDAVEEMVKNKGDGMGYTVAWDQDHKTNNAYMEAAKQGGIPTAFIVNGDGVVAYIGHPMGMDKPLEQIVAGTYDIKAAAAEAEAQAKKEAEQAARAQERAKTLGPIMKDLNAAMRKGDWDAFLAKGDELAAKADADSAQLLASIFMTAIKRMDDPAKAYAFGKKLVDGPCKDDAQALNVIAWSIVDPEGSPEKKDLDLAMSAAKRCDEVTKGKEAAFIDTLARVHFCKGDKAKALELQQKAVDLADGDMKEQLTEALEEYKKANAKN